MTPLERTAKALFDQYRAGAKVALPPDSNIRGVDDSWDKLHPSIRARWIAKARLTMDAQSSEE